MRNSDAIMLVPPTLPVVTQNGGEPERSGGTEHGYGDNEGKLRNNAIQRVPEHLWTIEEVPEGREGTGEVGAAPTTLSRTDAGDDNEEATA